MNRNNTRMFYITQSDLVISESERQRKGRSNSNAGRQDEATLMNRQQRQRAEICKRRLIWERKVRTEAEEA